MGQLGAYGQHLKFRDDLYKMAQRAISDYTIGPKQGVVTSGSDTSTGFATMVPNSETDPVLYAVGSIQPVPGAVALVDGPNGNRRVVDVITRDATRFNGRYLETWDSDLSVRAMGQSGGAARKIYLDHSSELHVRFGSPGGNPSDTMVADSASLKLSSDLMMQSGYNLRAVTMQTTTGAANLRWAGDVVYQISSASEQKLDIREMDVDYKFLNLKTYSWRDAGEVSRDSETKHRFTGTTIEAVQESGYHEFLTLHEITGDSIGVETASMFSKFIPLMRSMHMRLNVLEGKAYDDGLV